ncbi:MAG TPA: TonB-dependent receptor, partial [Xanthomonadaceae bacterium]|nr:TonB-dependent receptor [Xanthomonadaceae bacterium]
RHAQTVDDSLASVTIITREDIEKSPQVDVIDLLAQQAGIDISRTGGPGQSSTVFLRGANSNQTLVLIDGIRVASVSNGTFDFANIPLDQIERIEIVRGPRAAFWGSDAIGGVIQIFTRDPKPLEVRADGGSYGLRAGEVSVGTPADGDTRLGLTLGDERVTGFPAENPGADGFYAPTDARNDGFRNRNVSLHGSVPLGSQLLSLSAISTDAYVDFAGNGTPDAASTTRNTSGGLSLTGPVVAHWSQSLTVGGANEDLDTPVFDSVTKSQRTTVDWVNTIDAIAGGAFSFGGNWQHENGTTTDDYDKMQTNTAGFVGYDGTFGSQLVELAVRRDQNSQFGGATTGNAAWGWQINHETKLRLSWGQGFDAPSFDELYSPGFFGEFAGNVNLRPEHSQSFEAGLDFKPSATQTFNISAWRTRVNNLIDFDGPNFDAENIARADLDGVELSYRYNVGHWSAGTSVTLQNARDADTGEQLLRRPKRKLAADLRYDFGNGVDVSVDGLAASMRKDFPYGTFNGNLGSYALLNLAAGWKFAPQWRLEARLGNLFDKNYALAEGYNTPGRNGLLSVIWSR